MQFKNLLAQSILWRGLYFLSLLLVNVFLSRFLHADLAGVLYFVSSIFSLVQLIIGLSLESGIVYFGSSNKIGDNKLFWLSLSWIAIASIIVFAGLCIYAFYFLQNDVFSKERFVLYGVCFIAGQLMLIYVSNLFYAKRNFLVPNLVMFIVNILFVIIITSTYKFIQVVEIFDLYFFSIIVQGFLMMIVFIIKNKSFHKIQLPSQSLSKKLLQYSLTALIANVIFFLVYRIDYWFVNNSPVCTAKDLGNYIQASKLGQILWLMPQIIASAVFPQVASGFDKEVVNKGIAVLSRLFCILFIIVLFLVLLLGKYFFIMVFGNSFNEMHVPFILLLPGIYFLSVLSLLSAYFSGKGNVIINVKGAFAALIVVVVLDYFFVPRYGIYAAAIVSTLGYGVNLLYSLMYFNKDHQIHFTDFFRWKISDYYWLKNMPQKNK